MSSVNRARIVVLCSDPFGIILVPCRIGRVASAHAGRVGGFPLLASLLFVVICYPFAEIHVPDNTRDRICCKIVMALFVIILPGGWEALEHNLLDLLLVQLLLCPVESVRVTAECFHSGRVFTAVRLAGLLALIRLDIRNHHVSRVVISRVQVDKPIGFRSETGKSSGSHRHSLGEVVPFPLRCRVQHFLELIPVHCRIEVKTFCDAVKFVDHVEETFHSCRSCEDGHLLAAQLSCHIYLNLHLLQVRYIELLGVKNAGLDCCHGERLFLSISSTGIAVITVLYPVKIVI
jgi:hypothetical protein